MSKLHEKSTFIEYLRETPLVSFACKKTGIARATYYRWYKDDREFREGIQKVLRQGRANINDLAEATLIKMIKGENFPAIRFWLQHNNNRYVPVRTTYIEPITHSHVSLKPGETCTYCGTQKKQIIKSGLGAYEREIEENQKKFEAEAKKRRKLSFAEKQASERKQRNREKGIEVYSELATIFPGEGYDKGLEAVKKGEKEYIPPGMAGVPINKDQKKNSMPNDMLDDVTDRGAD